MFAKSALVHEMKKLERFAIRLTKNKSDGDDLVQSTCLRALEKSAHFQDGTNLFGWTSKIMFNIFVTNYRHRTKFESGFDNELIISNQSTDPRQEIDLDINRLRESLLQLKPDHCGVIQLIWLDGWSYHDTAKRLKIPIGTVRSRLARARIQLELITHDPQKQILPILSSDSNLPDDLNLPIIPAYITDQIIKKGL